MSKQELQYLTMQEIEKLTDREKQIISEIGYEEFLRRRQYPRNKMIGFKTDNEIFQKIVKESSKAYLFHDTYLHNFFSE